MSLYLIAHFFHIDVVSAVFTSQHQTIYQCLHLGLCLKKGGLCSSAFFNIILHYYWQKYITVTHTLTQIRSFSECLAPIKLISVHFIKTFYDKMDQVSQITKKSNDSLQLISLVILVFHL